MAYDLFFKTVVPKNIALLSSIVDTRELSPDPTPTTDADKEYLSQLAVLKMNADAGNKKAQKDWKAALKKISDMRAKAKKGDQNAARTLAVLQESGLFEGVTAMDVSGDYYQPDYSAPRPFYPQNGLLQRRLSHRARHMLSMLTKVKARADQGDQRAINLIATVKSTLGL